MEITSLGLLGWPLDCHSRNQMDSNSIGTALLGNSSVECYSDKVDAGGSIPSLTT